MDGMESVISGKLVKRQYLSEVLCWLMLTSLVFISYIPHRFYELGEYVVNFKDAAITSVIFTAGLIPVVYFNLVLKRFLFNEKEKVSKVKVLIFGLVILLSAFMFWAAIHCIDKYALLPERYIVLKNPVFVTVSVLVVVFSSILLEYLSTSDVEKGGNMEKEAITVIPQQRAIRMEADHIKIGTQCNYARIEYDKIAYLKGDGNEPIIYYVNDRDKKTCRAVQYNNKLNTYKHTRGNKRLKDYEEDLPSQFVRVHRSYIVSAKYIMFRKPDHKSKTSYFLLNDMETKIPIGATYESNIERNSHLQWEQYSQESEVVS